MVTSSKASRIFSVPSTTKSPARKTGAQMLSSDSKMASRVFRPWKTDTVETTGDYREEAWLETHIGGPLYEKQSSLPRLPVPSIQDTLHRFLPTALPLAKTNGEVAQLQAAVDSFPQQAAALQKLLLERAEAASSNSSWLAAVNAAMTMNPLSIVGIVSTARRLLIQKAIDCIMINCR